MSKIKVRGNQGKSRAKKQIDVINKYDKNINRNMNMIGWQYEVDQDKDGEEWEESLKMG